MDKSYMDNFIQRKTYDVQPFVNLHNTLLTIQNVKVRLWVLLEFIDQYVNLFNRFSTDSSFTLMDFYVSGIIENFFHELSDSLTHCLPIYISKPRYKLEKEKFITKILTFNRDDLKNDMYLITNKMKYGNLYNNYFDIVNLRNSVIKIFDRAFYSSDSNVSTIFDVKHLQNGHYPIGYIFLILYFSEPIESKAKRLSVGKTISKYNLSINAGFSSSIFDHIFFESNAVLHDKSFQEFCEFEGLIRKEDPEENYNFYLNAVDVTYKRDNYIIQPYYELSRYVTIIETFYNTGSEVNFLNIPREVFFKYYPSFKYSKLLEISFKKIYKHRCNYVHSNRNMTEEICDSDYSNYQTILESIILLLFHYRSLYKINRLKFKTLKNRDSTKVAYCCPYIINRICNALDNL